MVVFAAGGAAIKIGPVVAAAASSILAGAGIEVLAIGGAAVAPASFNAGGVEGEGGAMDVPASANAAGGGGGEDVAKAVNTETEMEVEVGGGGAGAAGELVGAIAILGAATAGASAGSWIWPSLIWETRFARARGRSASKR